MKNKTKMYTKNHNAKILIVDIETAPTMAYVWRMWKENIRPQQIQEHGWIMLAAAKWYGEKHVMCERATKMGNDKNVVKWLWKLMDEADIVIAHNAKKFDVPSIYGRFVFHKLKPPKPFDIVDTLTEARRRFNFPHNSLEGLGEYLDIPIKKNPQGFKLWTDCLLSLDNSAWKRMATYCKGDVKALECVYERLLPYMDRHPNMALFQTNHGGNKILCAICAGSKLQKRGTRKTKTQSYQTYSCKDCGSWTRDRFTCIKPKDRDRIGTSSVVT
jgi:hypothetical protein